MKRITFSLIFLFVLQSIAFSQSTPISKTDLQGTWICFESIYDDPMLETDDVGPWHFSTPETIIFEGDSLFEFNYPCELTKRSKYELKSDSINSTRPYIKEKFHLQLNHDTLSAFTMNHMGRYYLWKYIRGKRDNAIIKMLKEKNLNPECLLGTWVLKTEYESDYDGLGVVKIKFPFTLSYILNINKTNLSSKMSGNRQLLINADGKGQVFFIESFSEDNNSIVLKPGSWWKGECELIQYDLKGE